MFWLQIYSYSCLQAILNFAFLSIPNYSWCWGSYAFSPDIFMAFKNFEMH